MLSVVGAEHVEGVVLEDQRVVRHRGHAVVVAQAGGVRRRRQQEDHLASERLLLLLGLCRRTPVLRCVRQVLGAAPPGGRDGEVVDLLDARLLRELDVVVAVLVLGLG